MTIGPGGEICIFAALGVRAEVGPIAGGLDQVVIDYNRHVKALIEHRRIRDKRLVLADMNTRFTPDMLSDGIHPNDLGYAHMASAWFEAIRAYLP